MFIGKTEVSSPNLQPLGIDVLHNDEFDLEDLLHMECLKCLSCDLKMRP